MLCFIHVRIFEKQVKNSVMAIALPLLFSFQKLSGVLEPVSKGPAFQGLPPFMTWADHTVSNCLGPSFGNGVSESDKEPEMSRTT